MSVSSHCLFTGFRHLWIHSYAWLSIIRICLVLLVLIQKILPQCTWQSLIVWKISYTVYWCPALKFQFPFTQLLSQLFLKLCHETLLIGSIYRRKQQKVIRNMKSCSPHSICHLLISILSRGCVSKSLSVFNHLCKPVAYIFISYSTIAGSSFFLHRCHRSCSYPLWAEREWPEPFTLKKIQKHIVNYKKPEKYAAYSNLQLCAWKMV